MSDLSNFSYLIEGKIAGSGHPGAGAQLGRALTALREEGIEAILTLTEDPLDHAMLREFKVDCLHLPIEDFSAPTPDQIEQAMRFLADHTATGRGALVHCFAGYGRTGTILACYLVAEGQSAADAIEQVRRLRPGSIEDISQEEAIFAWEHRLKDQGKKSKSGDRKLKEER